MLKSFLVSYAILAFLIGCGAGSSDGGGEVTVIEPITSDCVDGVPVNENATEQTKQVLSQLVSYSCGKSVGVLVGQNAGHGNQIADPSHAMSYQKLVADLSTQTGQTPAVLGLDYSHDEIFTFAELQSANQVLINHWEGGD